MLMSMCMRLECKENMYIYIQVNISIQVWYNCGCIPFTLGHQLPARKQAWIRNVCSYRVDIGLARVSTTFVLVVVAAALLTIATWYVT